MLLAVMMGAIFGVAAGIACYNIGHRYGYDKARDTYIRMMPDVNQRSDEVTHD